MDNELVNDLLAIKSILATRLKVKSLAEALAVDERTLKSHLKKCNLKVDEDGAIELLEIVKLISTVASEKDQRLSKNKGHSGNNEDTVEDDNIFMFKLGGVAHRNDPALMVKYQEGVIKGVKAMQSLGQLVEVEILVSILRLFITCIITNCDKQLLDAQRSMDVPLIDLTKKITDGIRIDIARALQEQLDKYQFQSTNIDLTYLYDDININ